ncbi:MAG TPA: efflux RND transporter periplasmic adaptor subunit [Flavobacteriales bacterium]|nr:efflux RND transporter periplasmic adaptor subunit [Flavobacteriales bacterium]
MNKNAILILGGVILALVVVAVVRGGNRELPVVSTDTVQARDIVERVSASGKIQPEIEVKITAEVNGQIIDLPVKEGDVVEKGDLLVQLNPDIYEAALLRAEASLNSARSNLASARAQVAQGEANQFAAAKAFERAQTLLASKVISQAEFDQNEASFLTANANLTSAKESVRSAEFAIRSGEASLQEARDNLSRTTLVAPQAGVVTALSKEVGESVQGNGFTAGEVIMNVSDLSTMEVNVEVNESDIVRIHMDDEAEIEVDAYLGETFSGRVTEIGNTALNAGMNGFSMDQVTNFSVKIRLNRASYMHLVEGDHDHETPFRPGMSATVDVLTARADRVLSAPIQAVASRASDTEEDEDSDTELGVFLLVDGEAKWTVVETGIQDTKFVEIQGEVREEDVLITGPYEIVSRSLKDGEAVETR